MEDFNCTTDCNNCKDRNECWRNDEPWPRFGYAGDEAQVNDYLEVKECYCDGDRVRGGTVIKVFRDSKRVQRMVKFKDSDGFVDYCSLDEISLLEPYSR